MMKTFLKKVGVGPSRPKYVVEVHENVLVGCYHEQHFLDDLRRALDKRKKEKGKLKLLLVDAGPKPWMMNILPDELECVPEHLGPFHVVPGLGALFEVVADISKWLEAAVGTSDRHMVLVAASSMASDFKPLAPVALLVVSYLNYMAAFESSPRALEHFRRKISDGNLVGRDQLKMRIEVTNTLHYLDLFHDICASGLVKNDRPMVLKRVRINAGVTLPGHQRWLPIIHFYTYALVVEGQREYDRITLGGEGDEENATIADSCCLFNVNVLTYGDFFMSVEHWIPLISQAQPLFSFARNTAAIESLEYRVDISDLEIAPGQSRGLNFDSDFYITLEFESVDVERGTFSEEEIAIIERVDEQLYAIEDVAPLSRLAEKERAAQAAQRRAQIQTALPEGNQKTVGLGLNQMHPQNELADYLRCMPSDEMDGYLDAFKTFQVQTHGRERTDDVSELLAESGFGNFDEDDFMDTANVEDDEEGEGGPDYVRDDSLGVNAIHVSSDDDYEPLDLGNGEHADGEHADGEYADGEMPPPDAEVRADEAGKRRDHDGGEGSSSGSEEDSESGSGSESGSDGESDTGTLSQQGSATRTVDLERERQIEEDRQRLQMEAEQALDEFIRHRMWLIVDSNGINLTDPSFSWLDFCGTVHAALLEDFDLDMVSRFSEVYKKPVTLARKLRKFGKESRGGQQQQRAEKQGEDPLPTGVVDALNLPPAAPVAPEMPAILMDGLNIDVEDMGPATMLTRRASGRSRRKSGGPVAATGLTLRRGKLSEYRAEEKKDLRQLHWNKIPDKVVEKTAFAMAVPKVELFQELQDKGEEIDALFASTTRAKVVEELVKVETAGVLTAKRQMNFDIMLSKFPSDLCAIIAAVQTLDPHKKTLSDEQVQILAGAVLSSDEAKLAKQFGGSDEDLRKLSRAEKFAILAARSPGYARRVQATCILRTYRTSVKDMESSARALSRACKVVKGSKSFPKVISVILSVGNFLNEGTRKGDARGFRLETLPKLADVKSKDKNMSLLHYIVSLVKENDPDGLKFVDEWGDLNAAMKNSKEELKAMKSALEDAVSLCRCEVEAVLSSAGKGIDEMEAKLPDPSADDAQAAGMLCRSAEKDASSACGLVVKSLEEFEELAGYLGENARRVKIEDVFNHLATFRDMVKRVEADVAAMEEKGKKKG